MNQSHLTNDHTEKAGGSSIPDGEAGGFGATQPINVLPPTATNPDEEAVRFGDSTLSWTELETRARRFANGLRAEGIAVDGRWAILAHNRLEWAEMIIGNGRAGARYVPLNWHLTQAEIHDLLVDSGATLLITDDDAALAERGAAAAADSPVTRILTLGSDYESWLSVQADEPGPDGLLGMPLQYTGGTTGRSKGVVHRLPDARATTLATSYGVWGTRTGMPSDDNMLLCTPAYHALGGALVRTALARGNRLDILAGWDPEVVLATIEKRKIAGTAMVPTQFIRLLKLDESDRNRFDLSSLRWVLHTAAPCPGWVKRDMIEWFGPVIVELYGSSEGVGPVIATSQDWLARPGTVGKATDALELFIVDDDGNDLEPGEIGTIYARLAGGAPHYFGDEEKTEASLLADGRFTVGDVGWLDEDGYLFLADRRADLILIGGSNVYPAEIEAVLSEHPDVADVAVFGIPDAEWGQQIKAVVEPNPNATVDVEALRAFAAERLAKYKLPASIDVVDALPREASGKLKKHRLRDPYWEEAQQ